MSKKFLVALAVFFAHVIAVTGVFVGLGITGYKEDLRRAEELKNTENRPSVLDKFTGVLERGATLQVVENDIAIERGYFDELVSAFNAEYAEYGITAVDAHKNEFADLEKEGPYGFGPDIIYQANDHLMGFAANNHIQPIPIDRLDCYSEISQEAWDAYAKEFNGEMHYCGVPVNIQAPVLYYRKSLLPNGSEDVLKSWNSIYKFSHERKSQGKYGYMKSLLDPYFSMGYLFSYGGYVFGDNNTNPNDIGLSKNGAEKGAGIIRQLAETMSRGCFDHSITPIAYSRLATGEYFATMTTPDVFESFITAMKSAGMTDEQARAELGVADIPALPVSGDLSEEDPELMPSKTMGGVNGYAISAYSKYPNAALAFLNFATSYERVMRRNFYLGVAPARDDAAETVGGLSKMVRDNLAGGRVVVMPSIKEIDQVWMPVETFFKDVANDPFRTRDHKYLTLASMKAGLEAAEKNIRDAIFVLG